MSVLLSESTQHQIEDELVNSGVITKEELDLYKAKSEKSHSPLFALLIKEGVVKDEELTQATAKVNNIPYVNLSESPPIPQKVLDLLTQDVASYYMAIPLGTMGERLVVAMLDANNVQAVDFLSNKI